MECFTVDFLQFPSKDVTICLLGDWLGILHQIQESQILSGSSLIV